MTTDDEHFLTDSQRPRDCKTREGPNNIFSESCLAISLQLSSVFVRDIDAK